MTDIVLLREKIEEKKCSVAYLARMMNRTSQTVFRKLKGEQDFTVTESKVLRDVLCLTDEELTKIFYS